MILTLFYYALIVAVDGQKVATMAMGGNRSDIFVQPLETVLLSYVLVLIYTRCTVKNLDQHFNVT